jgi:hypothetical protein
MTGIDGCQCSAFVFENKWISFSGWVRVNGFETLRDRGEFGMVFLNAAFGPSETCRNLTARRMPSW